MARPPAVETKIVGRFHNSRTEVVMPEAIHHHARKQGILVTRDPGGQPDASRRIGGIRRQTKIGGHAPNGTHRAGRHHLTPLHDITTREKIRSPRISRRDGIEFDFAFRLQIRLPL